MCSCGEWERSAGSRANLQVSWLEGHIFAIESEQKDAATLSAKSADPDPLSSESMASGSENPTQILESPSPALEEIVVPMPFVFDAPSSLSEEARDEYENRYPSVFEKFPRAWSSWSEEEDAHLCKLYEFEKDPKILAEAHRRRVGGILARLVHLGIVDSKREARLAGKGVENPKKQKSATPLSPDALLSQGGLDGLSSSEQWGSELTDALIQRAEDEGITISEVIQEALRNHLKI